MTSPITAAQFYQVYVTSVVVNWAKLGSAVVLENDRVVGVFTTTDGMRVLAELLAR